MKIPYHRSKASAFTLIELLVVIAIIAILATVAVPVTGKVKESARKASANNDCMQLQNAIKGFYAEYFRYPTSAETEGPYPTDGTLMDVLMAAKNGGEAEQLNPRAIPYYEPSKVTTDPTLPGFDTGSGRLNDPWSEMYEIWMDADDDEELNPPQAYESRFGKSGRLRKSVFVHSGGPDRKFETVKDNLTSWD